MTTRPAGEKSMQLDVTILGREYKVACKESERSELMQAVAVLDKRMREIRDGGKVAAIDRIAVMAALNLAHDLLRARAAEPEATMPVEDPKARKRIQSMNAAIDQMLAGQEKLL
jgi:cell division protein ZapA